MDEKPDKATKEKWLNDNANWKWGMFYYNPADKRIFPPKRIPWMGWTTNFANPISIAGLIFLILLLVVITVFSI